MPKIDVQVEKGCGLAVNLFDLDRVDAIIKGMLLGGKLCADRSRIVRADKTRPDETGVEFVCDLLTAACCCDTLRNHDRQAGDYPTRVYLFRRTWSKLPGQAILTIVEDDRVKLNPILFGEKIEVERAPYILLPRKT